MRILLAAAAAGSLVGAGMWALARTVAPPQVPLARVIARLDPPAFTTAEAPSSRQPRGA